jgi:hypothetical protein
MLLVEILARKSIPADAMVSVWQEHVVICVYCHFYIYYLRTSISLSIYSIYVLDSVLAVMEVKSLL